MVFGKGPQIKRKQDLSKPETVKKINAILVGRTVASGNRSRNKQTLHVRTTENPNISECGLAKSLMYGTTVKTNATAADRICVKCLEALRVISFTD
jgi:hypothetical protein